MCCIKSLLLRPRKPRLAKAHGNRNIIQIEREFTKLIIVIQLWKPCALVLIDPLLQKSHGYPAPSDLWYGVSWFLTILKGHQSFQLSRDLIHQGFQPVVGINIASFHGLLQRMFLHTLRVPENFVKVPSTFSLQSTSDLH